VLGHEQDVYPYDHSVNAEGQGQMLEGLPVPEYSLLDTVHVLAGLLDTFAIMYPQLQDIDLRADVPRLDVPIYLAQGRYEARGRAEPAREWFDALEAPVTRWIEFPTSGHRPLFEQPELFHEVMTATVLAETRSPS
jgi:pimeloyl-ACP methyl ester carboxylesterase